MNLEVSEVVLQSQTLPSLYSLAKCYKDPDSTPDQSSQRSITLIFAHALGYSVSRVASRSFSPDVRPDKEHWEPTLCDLLKIARDQKDSYLVIKEAWCVDCQDHGSSAVANIEHLRKSKHFVSCYDYAEVIYSLLSRVCIDADSYLVLVGHSAGAAASILSTTFSPSSKLPIHALILVEPAMISPSLSDFAEQFAEKMAKLSLSQRDTWRSIEEARYWMLRRPPTMSWDPRVLERHLCFGLHEVTVDNQTGPSVTVQALACTKEAQATAYHERHIQFEALEQLDKIATTLPVHMLFGERNDYIPRFVQDAMCEPKRKIASVTRIPQVGHLAVQEKPYQLAQTLFKLLQSSLDVDSYQKSVKL
ncbi:hypothetical protein D9757_007768 [Collybiopsis confluens]|uniref:AB hydrolase-1 domain-containing protein n=1 Tax=Collybiopsis confluens TaxID=2823264 RepID=A0A8H5GN12_9AGAR|nr:hypothetical protein D9757_011251 [Collybiopsis confluens]KAF5387444.1 hypothetical protein D9757_007768 [Collybiopsis confluens]